MLFERLAVESMQPTISTFVAQVKACVKLKDTGKVQLLHAQAAQTGLLKSNAYVGNTLVDIYAKCGAPVKAQEVFDMLCIRDVVTWTALIAGYVQHGCGEEALDCYDKMLLDGVCPNAYTFSCVLKACASTKAMDKGIKLHSAIVEMDCVRSNPYICNALLDMYIKCGMRAKACDVFNNNPVRDVVSWTSLVAGYIVEGQGEEALSCFKQMQSEGLHPNAISFTCILSACSSINAIIEGREFHAEIEKKGLLESDLVLGTALVNMYAKCGMLEKAQEVFDRLPVRDVVIWTALIVGYEGSTCSEEALKCLNQMQVEGFFPDSVTLTCSLKACGSSGASDTGKEIHAKIAAKGLSKRDAALGNALVGMYAKCGLLSKAKEAFNSIPTRDVVSWTTLITGYAQLGKVDDVIRLFERMRGEGTQPDPITFITVLNACSHSGLVEKGQTYFEAMSEVYGIAPTLRHHSCMLDLHGRAGQLQEAVAVANKSPIHPGTVMWHTMLGACQKWGDTELGKHAFGQSLQADDEGAAASHVYIGNILANAQMQGDTNLDSQKDVDSRKGSFSEVCLM